MITVKQAIKIARKVYPGFDNYTETKSAYIFGDSSCNTIGGFGSPMVVFKEDGSTCDYPSFIIEYNEEEGEPKKI